MNLCGCKKSFFLNPEFDYIVIVITESKDLVFLVIGQLMGSLQMKRDKKKEPRKIRISSLNKTYTKRK